MAVIAAAQLLDELMGRNRNVAPNEKFKEVNWEDAEYCKFFLVKFCPHDLFVNTRNDLGACPKVHDEEARKLFEKAKPIHHRKLQYQEDFLRFCASMMNDVERRIIKGKQRLALNASAKETPPSAQSQQNEEQINILNEKIEDLEAQAEKAGTEGNVEHAQGILKLCDQLKEERDALLKPEGVQSSTAELAAAQEKQMEVCEVCGAFLIVGDAQQRLEDHLMGKQHMGFSRMKTAVDEITEAVREAREMLYGGRSSDKREKDRLKDFSRKDKQKKERDYEKDLEKARSEHREKEEKEKENERDRRAREKLKMEERNERRETHREREPHREKDRHRERDRERHRDREKEERRHKDTSRHRYSHHRRKH
ncbi:luc7-like protein 3 [Diorhabda carinulata]|uniref:luc7-like protein 3 n=1 Tax=Diorhabda sublineata TaxID=1163346 RepID=UPI0024E065F6|nr:luc7-like protein 3 [Diorhabda sublineata]XP_057668616.1 luc7-like protein 3 [Diorhabda carinulata]XP_057668617.1 luc7-like protein 3 [Diorhabda carinulata]